MGNGDTIVAFAGHNCQLWAKSDSQLLQNTSSNLCCRWTHIHKKLYYRTFSSRAHPFLEKDWQNHVTVPVDFANFQNDCVSWKKPIKKVYKFMLNERMFEFVYAKLRSKTCNMTSSLSLRFWLE